MRRTEMVKDVLGDHCWTRTDKIADKIRSKYGVLFTPKVLSKTVGALVEYGFLERHEKREGKYSIFRLLEDRNMEASKAHVAKRRRYHGLKEYKPRKKAGVTLAAQQIIRSAFNGNSVHQVRQALSLPVC